MTVRASDTGADDIGTTTGSSSASRVWRTPIMPVAIGLYLPFGLSVTIFLGALAELRQQKTSSEAGSGLLFAGMVAGEALTGVVSGALITAGIKLPLF